MRFKMDENLPAEFAVLFQEAGHDAVTVLDQELGGTDDPEVASVCLRERRAIVTLDTDFSDIRTYPPRMYSGIVVLRVNDQARDHLLHVGRKLLGALPDEIEGRLFIVEESRIRIRD